MTPRIASGVLVSALARRVHDAGGSAMILARGDRDAGAILVLTMTRGADPRLFERGIGSGGRTVLVRSGPQEDSDPAAISDYIARRRRSDPDLWVIELDIADAERFAAETIVST